MTFKFAGHFRRKMLILATITGILISILTPVTYFALAYGGQLGYVEVTQSREAVIVHSLFLLLGCSVFGTICGILLYKFPTKIINESEGKIEQIMKKLEQLSYYDMLTNLPNRVMLDKCLSNILENAKEKQLNVGILFLDLDRFKIINDTLGHAYGDILLNSVADRLRNNKLSHEIIARQGGDEFIIVIPGYKAIEEIKLRAIKIIESLARPFEINERQFTVTTSVGISLYPQDGTDIKTLIKHADLAMYIAKEQGKNKYCFYSLKPSQKVVAL